MSAGDQNAQEQAFTNLLNNAIKFSGPGSEISLWTELKDKGVSVWIKDRGVGLYIVRSMVEEPGGRVCVQSKLTRGLFLKSGCGCMLKIKGKAI